MSPTSYQTAPSRDNDQMVGEGFEPSKAVPTDLQSAPFGHSGIQPYIFKHLNQNLIMTRCEAVDRTWTGNLLITNQLLCQLSHNGIVIKFKSGTNRTRTYDPLLVRQMLSQLSYDPKYSKNKATRMGIEPTTSAVTGRRSNQLSHRALFNKGYTFKTTYKNYLHLLHSAFFG